MTDFGVRIFLTNYYLTTPTHNVDHAYNEFTCKYVGQVPIIRVYGSTSCGQKVCAHIHGVYPYFYVPFDENESILYNSDIQKQFLLNFTSSLDQVINLALNYNPDNNHVFKVSIVKGRQFYGYQENFQYFLKIYLFNPAIVKKVSDLLINGALNNRKMQPFETHIPYNLQFLIDYNLYGMNYLFTNCAKFRVSKEYQPKSQKSTNTTCNLKNQNNVLSQKMWNMDDIDIKFVMDSNICSKLTKCELEVDICACDILNIHEIQSTIGQNPGLKSLWEEEKERRINLGMDLSNLVGEEHEDRPFAETTESHDLLMKRWMNLVDQAAIQKMKWEESLNDFLNASFDDDEENEFKLDTSFLQVDKETVTKATQLSESFIMSSEENDVNDDNVESDSQKTTGSQRKMKNFVKSCFKLEEDDSIIPMDDDEDDDVDDGDTEKTLNDDMDDNEGNLFDFSFLSDKPTSQILSFSQASQIKREDFETKEKNSSSEDLFSKTFYDLTLDDSDRSKGIPGTSKSSNDKSSEDLFPGISISSQSTTSSQLPDPDNSFHIQNFDGVDDSGSSTSEGSDVIITAVTYPESTNINSERKERKKSFITDYTKQLLSLSKVLKLQSHKRKSKIEKNKSKIIKKSLRLRTSQSPTLPSTPPPQQQQPSTSYYQQPQFTSTPTQHSKQPIKMMDIISPISKEPTKGNKYRHFFPSLVKDEKPPNSPRKLFLDQSCIVTSQKMELLKKMKHSVTQSFQTFCDTTIQQTYSSPITDYKFCHLTLFSMELFAKSRLDYLPDPNQDEILMIQFSVIHVPDSEVDNDNSNIGQMNFNDKEFGIIYIQNPNVRDILAGSGLNNSPIIEKYPVINEEKLFDKLIEIVQLYDPDILIGYDTHRQSWGYLLQRAAFLKHKIFMDLGRNIYTDQTQLWKSTNSNYLNHLSELHYEGRIIFDLWAIFRHELTETSYSFENSVYTILKERTPYYANQQLLAWWKNDLKRHIVLNYFKFRTESNIRMLLQLNTIQKMSEFARIYGIELYHVMSRGTQFRVESMMLRLAKPQSLIAVSPTISQRTQQKAAECIPLTLEPQSKYYKEPVAVLDFQSLYPSIMIAYNYCYASCIGKLRHIEDAFNSTKLDTDFELGCYKLNLPCSTILNVGDLVNISPNGVVFVKESITKGIISKMVDEILNTRIMVKKSMKLHKSNKNLCKVLDNRQLGLKLIANVTYGYTNAAYSGRMPCVEVGDSIVRKARETLERVIKMIENMCTDNIWPNIRVVYGDTDSVFVHMPGRTKEEAFQLGQIIADTVTASNPFPVKLKFEKIYQPLILQSKKRYVGFSYETVDQKEPTFDAKGIETVRRDNCNIVSNILQRSLERLFESHNTEIVKRFVVQELRKIMEGRYNLLDFIIAKEYRGRNRYKTGASVPALAIAAKLRQYDPRAEPRNHDRVPYLIVQGAPNDTLISCVRHPLQLLFNTDLMHGYCSNIRYRNEFGCRISHSYYITKQILPPLYRALSLLGTDVFKWYSEMPKYPDLISRRSKLNLGEHRESTVNLNRTISTYFQLRHCIICEVSMKKTLMSNRESLKSLICQSCLNEGLDYLYKRITVQLTSINATRRILVNNCLDCCHRSSSFPIDPTGIGPPCISIDCPVLYERISSFQLNTSDLESILSAPVFLNM